MFDNKLDFIVIGAQKAGTTLLQRCLESHPDIYIPHYETLIFEDPFYQRDGLRALEEALSNVRNENVVGIKRPDYLAHPESPKYIHEHYPNIKLLAVLREPVDRLVSAYYWYMQVGLIPVCPFDEGIRHILEGAYSKNYPRSADILEYGFYARHIKRYLAFFPPEQLYIINYADLRQNISATIASIYRFLGVNENFLSSSFTKRHNTSTYSLTRIKCLSFASRKYLYHTVRDSDNFMYQELTTSYTNRLIYKIILGVDRYILRRLFVDIKPVLSSKLLQELNNLYAMDWNECTQFIRKPYEA